MKRVGRFGVIARFFACFIISTWLMFSGGQSAQAVVLPSGVTITTWTLIPMDDLLIPVPTPFNPSGTPIFADFNGDGKQDLLVQALDSSGTTYLFLADANGKYTSVTQQWKNGHLNLNWSSDTSTLWVGDYNSDGRADIIVDSNVTGGRNALIYSSSSTTPIDTLYQTWDNPATTNTVPSTTVMPETPTAAGGTAGSFNVTPSGAASYNIPFAVPPGINGLTPNLSLIYNSQGGNGIAGMGWNLAGLSAIHRCPRTIAQDGAVGGIDFSANDRFCLDGQRLVAIGSNDGGTEYRTEIESYSRVIAYGGRAGDPSYFKVWSKDGKVAWYGNTADSRIEAQGRSDNAAMSWAINSIEGIKNNTINFTYYENSTTGESRIDRINYGGNRSVRFAYEGRTDTFAGYEAGSLTSNTQRLAHVKTYITEAGADTLIRDYRLYYETAPTTSRSRLKYFQECTVNSCLAATAFDWRNSGNVVENKGAWITGAYGNWNAAADRIRPMDVNGDGLQDIVIGPDGGGNWYVLQSTGNSFQNKGTWITGAYGNWDAASSRIRPMDVNGDGLQDIVIGPDGGGNWYVLQSTGSSFQNKGTWITGAYGNWDAAADRIRSMDANGDGLQDVVIGPDGGGNWYVLQSTGSSFQNKGTWITGAYGNWDGSSSRIRSMDTNGDGLQDIVIGPDSGTGNWYVLQSTGSAFQNKGAWITGAYANWDGSSSRIRSMDTNGDGLRDIVIGPDTGTGNWYVLQSTGSAFQNKGAWITGTYANWDTASERIIPMDTNGDGAEDIVLGPDGNGNWYYMKAAEPLDLITTITTGLGAATTIQYKPLTDSTIYTKYSGATPGDTIDVQNPMYVVASHSVSNGVGGVSSVTHKYEGLKLKLNGRGLLGFATVSHTDTTSNITTSTSYKQTFPYIGLPSYASTTVGGVKVSEVSMLYTLATDSDAPTSSVGTDGVTRYNAPYAYYVSENKWELDGTATTTTTTNIIQNRYGSVKDVSVITTGDGHSYTKSILNDYVDEGSAPTLAGWHKVAQIKTATATNTIDSQGSDYTRKSSFDYYTSGLLKSETIEPDNATLKQVTTYDYDGYGNRTTATVSGDGLASSRTSTTTYSPDGLFPVSVTNALGHVETRAFDARFGVMTSLTGPNKLTTTWYYDEYGRSTGELRADGTSSTTAYTACTSTSCVGNEVYYIASRATASPTTTVYYDMFGRELRRTTEGFDGRLSTKKTVYNSKGQVEKVSLPYFPGETEYWVNYTYDSLGRVKTEIVPATVNVPERKTTTVYAAFKTTVTDGRNFDKVREVNALGQLVRINDVDPDAIAPATYTPIQTLYDYDYFGNLRYVRDPNGNVTRTYYDLRGRKIGMDDPDMGHWEYEYNTVGELIKQWDAKSGRNTQVNPNDSTAPTVTMEYDALGRLTKRTEAEGISQWTYDTASMGKGKLTSVTGPGGYSRSHGYDTLGRPVSVATTIAGDTFTQETGYDAYGRIESTRYPETTPGTRLQVNNIYTATGYLYQTKNASTNQVYWQANKEDAAGRITEELLGNGLTTKHTYDPQHGYLMGITTGVGAGGTGIQNLGYSYYVTGNLQSRTVGLPESGTSYSESYTYDAYNRLRTTTGTGGPASKSYSYDVLGNIKSKSDTAADYVYGDTAHIHAVTSLKNSAGTVIATYSYDANGNMIYGNGRTTDHTSYNLPWNIVQGSNSITFAYDADHQRMLQITNDEITTYLSPRLDTGTHFEKVNHTATGVIEYKHYIYGGSGPAAIYTVASNSTTVTTRYLHKDHLGSIEAITNETGQLVERLSYDAFGKRRQANGVDSVVTVQTTRYGFTSQEMLDAVGLVHMNGRVYDPVVGRFIEADPTVQAPSNSQSYNRYTYVMNNPLVLMDLSGYSWLDDRIRAIPGSKEDAKTAVVIGISIYAGWAVSGLIANSAWATCTLSGGAYGGFAGAVAGGAASGAVMGAASGQGINGIMQGAAMGALSGGITYGIGSMQPEWGDFGTAVAHGVAQGGLSYAQGGQFAVGFAWGFGGKMGEGYEIWGSMVVGGVAARLSGGSFANGAMTGAYVYLFNASLHTDMRQNTTTFDPRPEDPNGEPFTIETRVRVDSHSLPGAGDPFETDDIVGVRHRAPDPRYGPNGAYIDVGDSRSRNIHGGGSSLSVPYADQQGWRATFGCTRGQNIDVINLGRRIEDFQQRHPDVSIPYTRN